MSRFPDDTACMRRALELAQLARDAGEVPVGALLTRRGDVLAEAHNAPIGTSDPTAHAEIRAIRAAAAAEGVPRLPGTTLYVSLEPCLMCLAAMVHARVERLVFAAPDPKVGATALFEEGLLPRHGLNHRFEIVRGPLAEESASMLRDFFAERR